MLKRIIAFSLDRPLLVVVLAVALVAWVASQISERPMDVFPEVEAPTVVVLSECAGLSSVEVEQYVSLPIETAVNGLPEVKVVRSGSALGFSMVQVQFEWGTDVYLARQLVSEALDGVRESMPPETHTELSPITGILGEIILLSVSVDPESRQPATALELREFAQFDLRSRLLSVPGVAQVVALGGELPEFQVRADPQKLLLYELSFDEVVEAASEASSTAGAGYLPDVNGRELSLRHSGQIASVEELRRAFVGYQDGAPITLGDVAEVEFTAAPSRGAASDGGRDAVVLGVKKTPGTNTLEVTRAVDEALKEADATLPEGMILNPEVMRQSNFIQLSLDNVRDVLRDAALFVALVLILFLMNARTCSITLTALPLSLALALGLLWSFGLTLNVMTLGGLAVALGAVVDDAIIDVENVVRRIRKNAHRPADERLSLRDVVFEASNEIREPVLYASTILCLVLLPLMFLEGLEGRFFRPLALAYIAAIGASLLVAMSLTPVLCRLLLRKDHSRESRASAVVRALERGYAPLLEGVLRHRRAVLGCALVLVIGSLLLASTFGSSFLPEFNEGTFTVFLFAPPGTSLVESSRMARQVERQLTEIEGTTSVVRRTGRAEGDAHAEPVSNSEIEVSYRADADREEVRAAIDRVLGSVPGIGTQVGQPIEHRLSHMLSGTLAAIAVDLYGEDSSALREVARDVAASMRGIPDVRDVALPQEATVDSVDVRYRSADLTRWGFTRAEAARQVRAAFAGVKTGRVYQGIRSYDVVVRYDESVRDSVDDVRQFMLRGEGGALLRLHEIADVGRVAVPMAIRHENLRRKATVSCNVEPGSDLGGVVAAIEEVAEPIAHARGCTVSIGGQHEAQQSASRRLLFGSLGVLVMIFMLLTMSLRSTPSALVVLLNLPLGLIGGVAAIYLVESADVIENTRALLFGQGRYRPPVVSIASLVGFLTLFGIAVRGGILLVQRIRKLESDGRPVAEAIRVGSRERLIPILMTSTTAILGLLPLAWARGEPGSELLAPLAVVVLGGLVSATILNLLVVPVSYALVFDRRKGEARTASSPPPIEEGPTTDRPERSES